MQQVIAKYRYARSSAQKLRLVANLIRGKKVDRAINLLIFNNKKAAFLIRKTLESAIANAINNFKLDIKKLKIIHIYVDQASIVKRVMPRAKGRADRILKRSSHITIIISSMN